jgi:hypothetical protein
MWTKKLNCSVSYIYILLIIILDFVYCWLLEKKYLQFYAVYFEYIYIKQVNKQHGGHKNKTDTLTHGHWQDTPSAGARG